MLILKNINKSFKDKILFKDINYTFKEGHIYLIKGENGSGKSVLLKMISGFSKPDSGTILIDGKTLYKDIDFINDAGISINEDDFISYLTGYENLKMLININKKINISVAEDLAKKMGLKDDFYKIPYKSYSQGMKQKLRLVQAFMENPRYIILDEPSNALDNASIDALYTYIHNLDDKQNKTIILVSHNDDKISLLADKVIYVENNNLIENSV